MGSVTDLGAMAAATAALVQGISAPFTDYLADAKERLERERKRQHRRRLVGGIIAGTLLVATFIAGILTFQTDDDRDPPASARPPGVAVYDIAGDDAPEFVKIDGEILPVTAPSEDTWWVPFLPFLGVVLAALIAAGASLLSDRRRAELEDRISGIEAIVKASATTQPAQVTSGADKQAHGP